MQSFPTFPASRTRRRSLAALLAVTAAAWFGAAGTAQSQDNPKKEPRIGYQKSARPT